MSFPHLEVRNCQTSFKFHFNCHLFLYNCCCRWKRENRARWASYDYWDYYE